MKKTHEKGEGIMAFCTYSKDVTANMYTSVENRFITKYLPQAEGDAVRVYLYGLYLCQCAQDFDAHSAAKLLNVPYERFLNYFVFWEECDLVRILSREPLFVEYLPVNASVGKPKPIRAEKYAEFNRELYKILQRAEKDFKPYEMQRILEFLENNPMEQQAFLLVCEYCAKKDGDKLSSSHVLNKAAKLCREQKLTYEQVEQDLADFNLHEKEMSKIFTLLGIYRKPADNDYDYLNKWINNGMDVRAVYAAAEVLKKGSLSTLDGLVDELIHKGALSECAAREYLKRREELTSAVFKVARKLGVKVQNPRAYSDEYAEKWLERGYDEESLTLVAALAMKLGYGFSELDALIDELYQEGVVSPESVKEYCATRERQLRLIQKIQSICGVIRKTRSALDMVAAWRAWSFSDEMILEAAKRSANAAAPLPYMNKLLSEWKRAGAFTPSEIPEKTAPIPPTHTYRDEAAIAADARSERERHYAELRRRATEKAEAAQKKAEADPAYKEANAAVKKREIELAKAEIFSPEQTISIRLELDKAKRLRADSLLKLHLSEADLEPQYACKKCSDTGFLPDGTMCDCYITK